MSSNRLEQRKKEIENDIALFRTCLKANLNDDDIIEVQRIFTQYLAVSCYGVIESEMKLMLNEHVAKQTTADIARVVSGFISREYSWKFEKIRDTLSKFNPSWCEQAKTSLTDREKYSITSLTSIRNKIAHGDSYDATFERIVAEFENSIRGLQKIFDIVQGGNSQNSSVHD